LSSLGEITLKKLDEVWQEMLVYKDQSLLQPIFKDSYK
jgi:hypothetical protein